MRSLQLLLVTWMVLMGHGVSASNSTPIPPEFYLVTLPFDEADQSDQARLNEKAQQAMQILLMRLTGRNQLLESPLGQRYITESKKWLANYHIKPRLEDGVAIGKNIEFNFDAARLKKAFAEQHVKLWPSALRPKTLIMGSFVQQGRLQKLTQETLNYRIDVDFRSQPERLGLPIWIPDQADNWVFPVEPEGSRSAIQEPLITHDLDYLLSFKLSAKGHRQFHLDWMLFALSGRSVDQGSMQGEDRQKLFERLFYQVAERYLKQSVVKTIRKNHLSLSINQLNSGDLLTELEAKLAAQQPMIKRVDLVSLQAGMAQFDIEYQGEWQTVLNWLQSWPRVVFVGETGEEARSITVNVDHNYTPPEPVEENALTAPSLSAPDRSGLAE